MITCMTGILPPLCIRTHGRECNIPLGSCRRGRAVSFSGGADFTNNSEVNGEAMLKVTGAKAAGELYEAAWAEAEGVSFM